MSWIPSFFLNPSFVIPGAALIALPIIIHLINRMRYKRVRFAAMEFLLVSDQRNRRRVLIEQLLLLLLRILIVIAIMLLIARLIFDLGNISLVKSNRAVHVIVVDDSISMRAKHGDTQAFDQARRGLLRLVEQAAKQPGRHRATIYLLSDMSDPLYEQVEINEDLIDSLRKKLGDRNAGYETPSLLDALGSVEDYVRGLDRKTSPQVHIFSNFRTEEWADSGVIPERLGVFEELGDGGIPVNLIRTVSDQETTRNISLDDLVADLSQVTPGNPVLLTATVTNHSSFEIADRKLSVFTDGRPATGLKQAGVPVEKVNIPKIEPGGTIEVAFEIQLGKSGWRRIEARLDDDDLDGDNIRYLSIEVPGQTKVLVVDDDPNSLDKAYVSLAYKAIRGFDTKFVDVTGMRQEVLSDYVCIYLMNVKKLPLDANRALAAYLNQGGGVLWFVGDQVDATHYREELYAGGTGIFPVPLSSRILLDDEPKEPDLSTRDLVVDPGDEVFEELEFDRNPSIDLVSIFGHRIIDREPGKTPDGKKTKPWIDNDNVRNDGVETIMRHANGNPLMFKSSYGDGRMITVLTTAGPLWNNWPQFPGVYVPMQLLMFKAVSRRSGRTFIESVGQPWEVVFDPTLFDPNTVTQVPGKTREEPMTARPLTEDEFRERFPEEVAANDGEVPEQTPLVMRSTETSQPGIYRVVLPFAESENFQQLEYAFNPEIDAGDLEIASVEQLDSALGGEGQHPRIQIRDSSNSDWFEAQLSDSGTRYRLLILLIALIVAEQALAYRLSYH